jgi:hypothetical protein
MFNQKILNMSLIEIYCDRCKNYKFNLEKGIICGLTNQKPSFWEICPDFKIDRKRENMILKRADNRDKRLTKLESYDDSKPVTNRLFKLGITILFYILLNTLTYLGLSEHEAYKIIFLSIVYVPLIILLMSIRYLLPNERIVIFVPRKGSKVIGPGLALVFPFKTKYERINLNEKLPGWADLNSSEIDKLIKKSKHLTSAST